MTWRSTLLYRWLGLAVVALATSGVLSFGVVAARIPALASSWTNTDLARRVLVVHVDLGVVVWFGAFPLVLVQLWALLTRRPEPAASARRAPLISAFGAAMLLVGLVPGLGHPETINYVPMVVHWWYASALGVFFSGVVLAYLDGGLWRRSTATIPDQHLARALEASTSVVRIGILSVLAAVATVIPALLQLSPELDSEVYLELLMWGPGHLLQLANVAFVIVAWTALATLAGAELGRSTRAWGITAATALVPLLAVLILVAWRSPLWWGYRSGFTMLMQWGLFPAVVVFVTLVLVPGWRRRSPGVRSDLVWPLVASLILMVVGFGFGAAIEGSDLRIPGHYHACIGSVTLAYMALALILPQASWRHGGQVGRDRVVRTIAVLYGTGQLVFSSGLMIAGSYGLGRKTYGVDQQLDHQWQLVGLGVMAVGGALALSGGATWAWVALSRWLRRV